MRLAARCDSSQAEIIAALRKAGCYVRVIREPVDLLVGIPNGRGHRWQPIEVKRKDWKRPRADQAQQTDFIARYHIPVVKTAEEALMAAGLMEMSVDWFHRERQLPALLSVDEAVFCDITGIKP